jgi:cysteine desulfurase
MEPIYLDYNATSPLHPAIREAMLALPCAPFNPSSIHSFGREARRLVEQAKYELATALGFADTMQSYHMIFTASGSEANNLALRSMAGFTPIVSAVEHLSVLKSAASCPKHHVLPVDTHGYVDLEKLETLLIQLQHQGQRALVSVMMANNETGILSPLGAVADLAKRYNALLHSDAIQAFGRIPLSLSEMDVDMLTIAPHKVGGPQGVAALIIKKSVPLQPLLLGGGQQLGFRAGTEPVPLIVGLGKTAAMLDALITTHQNLLPLRNYAETEMLNAAPNARILGKDSHRLPNTLCITMPNVSSETQLIRFDMAGIAISAGSACSSGKIASSYVVSALGLRDEEVNTAIRISMGYATTKEEVVRAVHLWKKLYAGSTPATHHLLTGNIAYA